MRVLTDGPTKALGLAWAPGGAKLSQRERELLSVCNLNKPSLDLYRTLLAKKFQDLIDNGPSQALAVMQMSVEHAPRLWQIAQDYERSDWGRALVSDDLMAPLLARIDWAADGNMIGKPESTLVELLERV